MTPYYADDLVTLYCDEAQHVLPTLGAFDLLLTDPPYGIGETAGRNKGGWPTPDRPDWVRVALCEKHRVSERKTRKATR